ncbi:hypothetical protein BGZ60DRAFT_58887 [Tricladium varicosporioides]|nr:hypothetical protein BGZ60DRAFT_58887 [Hymenoscyphus varicosporioides]
MRYGSGSILLFESWSSESSCIHSICVSSTPSNSVTFRAPAVTRLSADHFPTNALFEHAPSPSKIPNLPSLMQCLRPFRRRQFQYDLPLVGCASLSPSGLSALSLSVRKTSSTAGKSFGLFETLSLGWRHLRPNLFSRHFSRTTKERSLVNPAHA